MANLKNTEINTNFNLPSGTTENRPASPESGMIRYNTDLKEVEFFNGTDWKILTDTHPEASGGIMVDTALGGVNYRLHVFSEPGSFTFTVNQPGTVDFLVIAGGGSGSGGGGGAGGVIAGSTEVTQQTYAITVGAGGSFKQPNSQNNGENGGDSAAFGFTAIGGGGGGEWGDPGVSGGSGGGAGQRTSSSGGTGISEQGTNGGFASGTGTDCPAGGGGGAGSPGYDSYCNGIPGDGGTGLYFGWIIGNVLGEDGWFAAGGGGGGRESGSRVRSYGGRGGASGGEWDELLANDSFTATGAGGGGGGYSSGDQNSFGSRYGIGGNGGNGIVVVRYKKNKQTIETADRTIPPYTPESYQITKQNLLAFFDVGSPVSYNNSDAVFRNLVNSGLDAVLDSDAPAFTEEKGGYFEFRGSQSIALPPDIFPSGAEITIDLWHEGIQGTFVESSLIEARDSSGSRTFNIHLPWENENIYFDVAGNRLQALVEIDEIIGWTHWAFTYSSVSGNQRIWRNGQIWLEGTGQSGNLAVTDQAALGSYSTRDRRHQYGNFGEFRIYDRELTPEEIQTNFDSTRHRYGV